MDEAGIEARGLKPLQPELDRIAAIDDARDLARVLGDGLRADVDPLNATDYHTSNLFGLFVAQGLEDPEHNTAYLLQGGLSMPDREYYLSDDKAMVDHRAAFLAYAIALLEQAGVADAAWTGDDTRTDADRFYSNRRAYLNGEPDFGRLMSAIGLG